jgi:hypothetical protein
MTLPFAAECRALAPRSLPHRSAHAVLEAIQQSAAQLPGCVELPLRDPLERAAIYSGLGFPGITLDRRAGQLVVRQKEALARLGTLDLAYLEGDDDYAAIEEGRATTLDLLRRRDAPLPQALAVQGWLVGPTSLASQVVDEQQRPLLYDEVLRDALTRFLRLRVHWLERQLARAAPATIICLDEPFLAAISSPFAPSGWDAALGQIDEVLAGVQGCGAVAVRGRLPTARLFETSLALLVVDDEGAQSLVGHGAALAAFVQRGGVVAYEIGSGATEAQNAPDAQQGAALLRQLFAQLGRVCGGEAAVARAALVAPHHALARLDVAGAEAAMAFVAAVSTLLRQGYGFHDNEQRMH